MHQTSFTVKDCLGKIEPAVQPWLNILSQGWKIRIFRGFLAFLF